jgi:hypothetical protein
VQHKDVLHEKYAAIDIWILCSWIQPAEKDEGPEWPFGIADLRF